MELESIGTSLVPFLNSVQKEKLLSIDVSYFFSLETIEL